MQESDISLDYIPDNYKSYYTYQPTSTGSVLTGICPHCQTAVVLTSQSLHCPTCQHQLAIVASSSISNHN